ncbi:MAG: alkyl hydroperoxide reductase subunit F [Parcubacteria group bacterium Gr01-1014_2]|nr:MAG: alkyl hydroperoxide reductase subunit F [Parcubacteria group bacterium Gr01-1014_2]
MEKYDLIIIGGSAAATAAGIYAKRRNLNFKIISKDFGGEVATSGEVDNYPGIPDTDGLALAEKFKKHLADYGVEPETGVEVEKINKLEDGTFSIIAKKGKEYISKAVIISTGVHPRELNVPGEKEFRNKGVSYCSVCDMPLFSGKVVATIGGGNSVLESGIMGADIASKVYVINKNPAFKGDQILMDNLSGKKNVEIIYNAMTTKIIGDGFVSGLKYKDSKTGKEKDVKVDGVFIHIGMIPNSGLAPEGVEKNNFGEIIVSKNCETSMFGLFAAGDVTDVPFKQIVIAAGQGTCALLQAVSYLNRLKQ